MKLYWKSMDIFYINWKLYWIITVVLLYQIGFSTSLRKGRLMIPPTYSALSHDLHIQLQIEQYSLNETQNLNLKITRIDNYNEYNLKFNLIGFIELFLNQNSNVTQITIPCNYFIRGGLYELEIVDKNNSISSSSNLSNYLPVQDERLKQQLDVRWPVPKLSVTPESIGTYPQQSLTAILEFPENECILPNLNNINSNSLSNDEDHHINLQSDLDLPEFWLELLYCGRDIYCNSDNITKSQLLYKEQVRGFPKTRIIKLSCELFGLAGHYIFKLKPDSTIPSSVSSSAYIKADWSEQFVFNVHARSIFPCDHSGIGVLFEYPSCILDQADRIRLFAKQRADVASLAPPTSLHYITEQRVKRGQHSLYFNCDLFSEKYVEYCFVYVSQAITNAVADVRMDCVPTLPVSESDTGGWGAWSEWTPCSTTCAGGTRNRYRFCDSPPPRYGAKFCEDAVCQNISVMAPDKPGPVIKIPVKTFFITAKKWKIPVKLVMKKFAFTGIVVSSTVPPQLQINNFTSTSLSSSLAEYEPFGTTTPENNSDYLVSSTSDQTTTDDDNELYEEPTPSIPSDININNIELTNNITDTASYVFPVEESISGPLNVAPEFQPTAYIVPEENSLFRGLKIPSPPSIITTGMEPVHMQHTTPLVPTTVQPTSEKSKLQNQVPEPRRLTVNKNPTGPTTERSKTTKRKRQTSRKQKNVKKGEKKNAASNTKKQNNSATTEKPKKPKK